MDGQYCSGYEHIERQMCNFDNFVKTYDILRKCNKNRVFPSWVWCREYKHLPDKIFDHVECFASKKFYYFTSQPYKSFGLARTVLTHDNIVTDYCAIHDIKFFISPASYSWYCPDETILVVFFKKNTDSLVKELRKKYIN